MQRGEVEPGPSVPWADRLHAARRPADGPIPPGERWREPPTGATPAGNRLGEGESLPWLEAPDDFDDDAAGRGHLARVLLAGFVVLALLVGAVWWIVRPSGPGKPDGSLVRAESGPYKVRPQAPGGKTFVGTGDTAYGVSEGESRAAALGRSADEGGDDGAAAATAGGSPSFGVQVGAFMDQATAEAGWTSLVQRNPMLSGVSHRVVAGPGDMGTVYRLQAVTGSADAAAALCQALREAGQECQVKP